MLRGKNDEYGKDAEFHFGYSDREISGIWQKFLPFLQNSLFWPLLLLIGENDEYRKDVEYWLNILPKNEELNSRDISNKNSVQKNIDLIAANHVSEIDSPFGSDYNAITVVDRHSEVDLGAGLKSVLAERLIKEIASKFYEKYTTTHS